MNSSKRKRQEKGKEREKGIHEGQQTSMLKKTQYFYQSTLFII